MVQLVQRKCAGKQAGLAPGSANIGHTLQMVTPGIQEAKQTCLSGLWHPFFELREVAFDSNFNVELFLESVSKEVALKILIAQQGDPVITNLTHLFFNVCDLQVLHGCPAACITQCNSASLVFLAPRSQERNTLRFGSMEAP